MSDNKGYNGWSNYETWNVALWMDNEQGSYELWRERAQFAYDVSESEGGLTREENAKFTLADHLKDDYADACHDMLDNAGMSSSVWADLLGAALSEVDWNEIAEHLIDECDKTDDSESEDSDETSSVSQDD